MWLANSSTPRKPLAFIEGVSGSSWLRRQLRGVESVPRRISTEGARGSNPLSSTQTGFDPRRRGRYIDDVRCRSASPSKTPRFAVPPGIPGAGVDLVPRRFVGARWLPTPLPRFKRGHHLARDRVGCRSTRKRSAPPRRGLLPGTLRRPSAPFQVLPVPTRVGDVWWTVGRRGVDFGRRRKVFETGLSSAGSDLWPLVESSGLHLLLRAVRDGAPPRTPSGRGLCLQT